MISEQMNLDFHPTMEDYEYIHSWMMDAYKKELPNSGLVHNIRPEHFEEGSIVVLRINGKAEAVQMYSANSRIVTFYILSLNHKYHHQGIGGRFKSALIDYFKRKGIVVAEVYEPSRKGLRLANKLKFKPKEDPYNPNRYRHKLLIDARKQNWRANRRIVIWKDYYNNPTPDYSWSLDFTRNKKPILAYAFKDWFIGIIENDEIIHVTKEKYIDEIDQTIDYIYITEDVFSKYTKK